MVARDAGIGQLAHAFFVYQAQRSAESDGSIVAQVAGRVANALQQLSGGASSADNEREPSNALQLMLVCLIQAIVRVCQVINFCVRLVVDRLGTPLAIFRATAGTCVDNGTEVYAPVGQTEGYLVGGFVQGFFIRLSGQKQGLRRGDVPAPEDFLFQVLYFHKGLL